MDSNTIKSLETTAQMNVPQKYQEFSQVFCKVKALNIIVSNKLQLLCHATVA